MKIIELLNKIANNEDVPNKIKYRNCIFEKTEGAGISPDYVNNDNEFFLEYISNEADSLNEIVEIIEDEEEIDIQRIKIKNISYVLCDKDFDNNMVKDIFNSFFRENQECIDTLAQALKQLDKKVNSIEQK